MTDLVLYLGITAVGYFIGSKIKDRRESLSWTGKIQTVALTVLVVLMGMRMGSNAEITENLSTIGVSAFIMTVVIVSFSIIAIIITRKLMGIDRYGRMKTADADGGKAQRQPDAGNVQGQPDGGKAQGQPDVQKIANVHDDAGEKNDEGEKKQGVNMMTVIIIVAVALGMATGYLVIRNVFADNMEAFDNFAGLGIKVGLCILLIFVGLDLGMDGTVIENFKKVGIRILAFPVVVVAGSLIGAGISGMVIGLSLKESLAVGAGFGWYTLAPGIIMEAGYMSASAISFLHNVMRELFSIILIPVVAAKVGYIETTGMPGAAAMDVCLPIVERSTRSDIAVYSFVSGVILSILVPILVPLIIG